MESGISALNEALVRAGLRTLCRNIALSGFGLALRFKRVKVRFGTLALGNCWPVSAPLVSLLHLEIKEARVEINLIEPERIAEASDEKCRGKEEDAPSHAPSIYAKRQQPVERLSGRSNRLEFVLARSLGVKFQRRG